MDRNTLPALRDIRPPPTPAAWLDTATLESVTELNEQILELIDVQGTLPTAPAWVAGIGGQLADLDTASRRRLSGSAVLLADAGFADPAAWSQALVGAVHDREVRTATPFFSVDGTVNLMRLVATQAWHLARCSPTAARLLLGVSPPNLTAISGCTLNRMMRLAESQTVWLRPRWEHRPTIWRDLLQMAGQGDAGAPERLRVRGLQLLAADARQG